MSSTSHSRVSSCRLVRWVAPAVLALVASLPARSQVATTPDTPAGRVLAAWLTAFNSGDRDRILTFEREYAPPSVAPIENMMQSYADTNGLDVIDILRSEPLYIEFLVTARTKDMRALGMFEVSGTSPPRVIDSFLKVPRPGTPIIGFDIDAATRERVIAAAIAKLKESYPFPEVATKMAKALRGHQKRGEYDHIKNGNRFANVLTTHLQEVSQDKHLRVDFSPFGFPKPAPTPDPQQAAETRKSLEHNNCGFERVEHLGSNIGYVKFNGFFDLATCGQTASAAMSFLANADAIIFDLRDNYGGDMNMVAFIASDLFDRPTLFGGAAGIQFWTVQFVPGKRVPDVPVYVLTS